MPYGNKKLFLNSMKIGIIKERKNPPDERVPFTPSQCEELKNITGAEVVVESSSIRRIKDEEYKQVGIELSDDLSDCDILFGVKEVPISALIPEKTYFFFSHTIKKQPYNRELLKAILAKKITLIDYECLTGDRGNRLTGFGKYAGIVGAYNALRTYGLKFNSFDLKPAFECHDAEDMWSQLNGLNLDNARIVLTGAGRVGQGAMMTLDKAGIQKVEINEYLSNSNDNPVYVQLHPRQYFKRNDGAEGNLKDIVRNPSTYHSDFMRYAKISNIYIAGHYWEEPSPFIFTREDAAREEFNISVVADISCDIDGPVASTIKPSTIEDPIYGYHPTTQREDDFMKDDVLAVMAVDNLPCELPRDASEGFGSELLQHIAPVLDRNDPEKIIERATIAKDGHLTNHFEYLQSYVAGVE